MQETITLRRFDDMHAHFRSDPMLEIVLPISVRHTGRAIDMPNTRPRAILTGDDIRWRKGEVLRVLKGMRDPRPFEHLPTIEIRDNTTPAMIARAFNAGAVAGKVYPRGVTNNSDEGLLDFRSLNITETFRTMQDVGMLLLLHGELDLKRTLVTKREEAFLPTLQKLAQWFPNLRIVLEHVSTRAGVVTVEQLGPNVAATITAHHLCLTLNDVIGDGIRPHNGCMPMPKDFDDRDVLIAAATSGNPKFFLGSDSAPHLREDKECPKGRCGVFSAPVLPQLLTEIFENAGHLEKLENFTSVFGAQFYNLLLNEGTITLVKKPWVVPDIIGGVVPFKAGDKLQWQLV